MKILSLCVPRLLATLLIASVAVGCASPARAPTTPPAQTQAQTPDRPTELVLPPPIFAADRPGAEPLRVAAPPARTITGFDGLHVGMGIESFERVSGVPTATVSRQQEEETWQSAGYHPDREVVFTLPFDEVRSYESPRVPLFKAFVQGDRVVALTFTVYSFEDLLKERDFAVGDGNACKLGGPEAGVARGLGTPDGIQHDPGGSVLDVHHYFDRGISVIAEQGRVVTFAVYLPLTSKQRDVMRRVLANPLPKPAP